MLQHGLVWGGFKSSHERLEVLHVAQTFASVWVKIADLADVLLTLSFSASRRDQLGVVATVLNDLDRHEIRLELE